MSRHNTILILTAVVASIGLILAMANTVSVDKIEAELAQNDTSEKVVVVYSAETKTAGFELTDDERAYLERVVSAEAESEGLIGKVLIAQCIRNSCELNGTKPIETCIENEYATPVRTASEESKTAVQMVFDDNYKYIDEPIQYFYASNLINSSWHEQQEFVLQYKEVRFFK